MSGPSFNVLFLCTGNSARSIMAECALNRLGAGRFRAFSAGSHPRGEVHPVTISTLRELGYDVDGLRSKSWDEFASPGAPPLDFVFTVCDRAAGEVCPIFPGRPITAHWGVSDPAAFQGGAQETRRFFHRIYRELETRVRLFTNLRLEELDRAVIEQKLSEIGRRRAGEENAS
jgi:arsenate reductase